MAHDLSIEILKQIRDELVTTRTTLGDGIAQTNLRLDLTNQRLDQTNQQLSAVAMTLLDLAEQQRFLSATTTHDRRLEEEADALRARVDEIEARLG